jgi:hypothetical protein
MNSKNLIRLLKVIGNAEEMDSQCEELLVLELIKFKKAILDKKVKGLALL